MADELKRKRGNIKGSLTRLKNTFVDRINQNKTVEAINIRLELIEKYYAQFCEVEEELAAYDVELEFEEFENKYLGILEKLRIEAKKRDPIQNSLQSTLNDTMSRFADQQQAYFDQINQSQTQISDVRLPRVDIPHFSGLYSEFPSFKDLYLVSIHHNNSLSNAHKFQYLRGLLRNEAFDLIKHITVTDANYSSAWDKVDERYNRVSHVISSLIYRFLDIPPANGTANGLRTSTNIADEVIRGLSALGSDAEARDPWLIVLLLEKLDMDSRQAWALHIGNNKFPKFNEFLRFLIARCDALEACEQTATRNIHKKIGSSTRPKQVQSHAISQSQNYLVTCIFCEEKHRNFECSQFTEMNIAERRNLIREKQLCFNCLNQGHPAVACKSRYRCRICSRKHHTLLHEENSDIKIATQAVIENATAETCETPITNCHAHQTITSFTQGQSVLPTAIIYVNDKFQIKHKCRVLLDSGSQGSFISEVCVQKLNLPRTNAHFVIDGVATKGISTRGKTEITASSIYNPSKSLNIKVLILDKLTSHLPSRTIQRRDWDFISNVQLADPSFHQPGEIDILIGADHFFELLLNEQIKDTTGSLIAQNTTFGWVIAGRTQQTINSTCSAVNYQLSFDIDQTLERFCELEEVPNAPPYSKTELEAEAHFTETHRREENGRYVVQLPFDHNRPLLGSSYQCAMNRFYLIEKRLQKDPELKAEYVKFMEEFRTLGHMKLLELEDKKLSLNQTFYLPHHPVFKNNNSKDIRVVFDGLSKTSTGISLNESLLVGPTIQPTLWAILIRFRTKKIALVADIEKMYRQVLVEKKHANFQRILWRDDVTKPLQQYKLVTVTYGTSAAPFLAIRTLHQLATDEKEIFQEASHILIRDFYVDYLLSGADSIKEAECLKAELIALLAAGGSPLKKWKSNVSVLCDIMDNNSTSAISFENSSNSIKILGLQWIPSKDVFTFEINIDINTVCTKRSFLSESSRMFDPLGWLAPTTIAVKILFQQLWLRKLAWDDPLPDEIFQTWKRIKLELTDLKQLEIPRFVANESDNIEIHGFCDASEQAYSAAIYCKKTVYNGNTEIHLLTAKTKVAPVRTISLPRLELCAAHLLTKIFNQLKINKIFLTAKYVAWTDSAIVLAWLSAHPSKWKTFVANRTAEILAITSRDQWNHVPSKDNPADCATRGLSPSNLIQFNLWWQGPTWLAGTEEGFPNIKVDEPKDSIVKEAKPERLKLLHHTTTPSVLEYLLDRISVWTKLIRVVAYVYRFASNTKITLNQEKLLGCLTTDELSLAERYIIKCAQIHDFAVEIRTLQRKCSLSSINRIAALAPFIDANGIMRVGGRLKNSICTYDTKHPIILHSSHILCKMILTYYHQKYLHPGPSLLFNITRQRFWIIGARNATRNIVRNCVTCCKHMASTSKQLMGNLPASRVTITRPFNRVGVDFAGPITLSTKRGRGAKHVKGYISVFVCLATKAVHLEVVSELTTDAFIAALKRFIGRRGVPEEIHSDNATNFVGAQRRLNQVYKSIQLDTTNNLVSEFLSHNGIQWKFIPPAAPHFGGIWEAAVKSTKRHLLRATGNAFLTYEEMSTLTTQIEAILNSRPLCPLNNEDVTNLDALTPGHFLIMAPLTALPEAGLDQIPMSRLNRWEVIQQRAHQFWVRYSKEYLHTLHQRTKWNKSSTNHEVGDLVILREDNLPPCQWALARISEVHKGDDGFTRVVTVQTAKSSFKRPISKVIKLPIS